MTGEDPPGSARYVFRVRFRLDPGEGVRADPSSFETTLFREADPPGGAEWLFSRTTAGAGNCRTPGTTGT